jgi:hypothetical protein
MVKVTFALLPIRDVKTHEAAETKRVQYVMKQIRSTGIVKKAIAVDAKSKVVLDGVHRLTALQMLGAARVPAWLVDYSDEDVLVLTKDHKSQIPKDEVVRAAMEGPKFAPKTTRHMVRGNDGALVHISNLEEDVSVPLSTLMQPR